MYHRKHYFMRSIVGSLLILLIPISSVADELGQEQLFLTRYAPTTRKQPEDDLSQDAKAAVFRAILGKGDKQADLLHGVVRFGELQVEPRGESSVVRYPDEEQIYFILKGRGTLIYGDDQVPVKQYDYMYLPIGVKHGIVNNSDAPMRVLVMGFSIPDAAQVNSSKELQLANADDVPFEVLSFHPPTTRYRLLMGTTESKRDRLAAAHQMESLFMMEFLPTGTNHPHKHETQEEIYYVLRGHGHMIAGLDKWGNGQRHPCQAGDVFYFAAGTQVGFYSGCKENEEPALILAVRSNDPTFDAAGQGPNRALPTSNNDAPPSPSTED